MQRILFANIGWMAHYQGNTDNDMIVGGGSYDPMDKHDVFNFQDVNGKCYGYVQVKGQMKLSNIDDSKEWYGKIDDVLVVWVATNDIMGGRYIVGWYNHATVYADYQSSGLKERKKYQYNIEADSKDCVLVPVDSRTFLIPRGKGFFGQAQTWYAKGKDAEEKHILEKFRKDVLDYINTYSASSRKLKKSATVDVVARQKVECAAVEFVCNHYKKLGYTITDVQSENLGWDLEATKGKQTLKLEVKGLGGSVIDVLISANEYHHMTATENKKIYRLCVVTDALTDPTLTIFNHYGKDWTAENDSSIVLSLSPRTIQATIKE